MSKIVFAFANVLFRNFYPVYRFIYFIFKRKQDAFEISLIKRYVKKGDVVLDIGANVGFYTEIIASIVGENGEVHAFEPDPVNFNHLKDSCKEKRNIFINNLAITKEPGELKLFTSNLLNVDHRTYPINDFGKSFTVKAESIDHYLKGKKVNFIKMDIQGAELYALQGMTDTLDKNQDLVLLTEFWPYGLKESGCDVEDFQNLLKAKGFIFYLIHDEKLLRLAELNKYFSRPEKEYFNLLLTRREIA
jgi:FkbM family methyltransferase